MARIPNCGNEWVKGRWRLIYPLQGSEFSLADEIRIMARLSCRNPGMWALRGYLWSAQWCTQWQVEVPHTDTWSMLVQLCINETAHTGSLQTPCRKSYGPRTMSKSLLIKSLYLSANVYLIYHKEYNKNSPTADIASPPPHWLLKAIFQVFLLQRQKGTRSTFSSWWKWWLLHTLWLSCSCLGIGHPLLVMAKSSKRTYSPKRKSILSPATSPIYLPFVPPQLSARLHLVFPISLSHSRKSLPIHTNTCMAVRVFVQGLTTPQVPQKLVVLCGGHHSPCRNVPTLVIKGGLKAPSAKLEKQREV